MPKKNAAVEAARAAEVEDVTDGGDTAEPVVTMPSLFDQVLEMGQRAPQASLQ